MVLDCLRRLFFWVIAMVHLKLLLTAVIKLVCGLVGKSVATENPTRTKTLLWISGYAKLKCVWDRQREDGVEGMTNENFNAIEDDGVTKIFYNDKWICQQQTRYSELVEASDDTLHGDADNVKSLSLNESINDAKEATARKRKEDSLGR